MLGWDILLVANVLAACNVGPFGISISDPPFYKACSCWMECSCIILDTSMFLLLLGDHLVTIFQLYDLFQDLGIHPNILIESSKSQTSTGGGRRWWPGSARPQWSWFLANFPNSNYKRGAIVTFDMNVSGKWPEQVLKLYPV